MAQNTLSLYQKDFFLKKKIINWSFVTKKHASCGATAFSSEMMSIMSLYFHLFLFNANDTKARVRPLP